MSRGLHTAMQTQTKLRRRELNLGLLRDKRKYITPYYSGSCEHEQELQRVFTVFLDWVSLEPLVCLDKLLCARTAQEI